MLRKSGERGTKVESEGRPVVYSPFLVIFSEARDYKIELSYLVRSSNRRRKTKETILTDEGDESKKKGWTY